MRLLALLCLPALAACANLREVHDHALEIPIADGFSQKPVDVEVPLHPTLPTQVHFRMVSRCAPTLHFDLKGSTLDPVTSFFGQPRPDEGWQAMLRQRVVAKVDPPRAATTARPAPPSPPPPPAAATVEVVPGHWEEQLSSTARFQAAFNAKEAEVCGEVKTWEYESPPIDPGTPSTRLTLWADYPQLLAGASVHLEVDRLEPPRSPSPPSSPPAPGATWQEGRWQWRHDGAVASWAEWQWQRGHWLKPVDARPPPLKSDHPWFDWGKPDREGAFWVHGDWGWGEDGWEWRDGFWGIPVQPAPAQAVASAPSPAAAPPPMSPRAPAPAPCVAGPPPEPKAEEVPVVPANAVWVGGYWRSNRCGWDWVAGRMETAPGPNYVWVPPAQIGIEGHWVVRVP